MTAKGISIALGLPGVWCQRDLLSPQPEVRCGEGVHSGTAERLTKPCRWAALPAHGVRVGIPGESSAPERSQPSGLTSIGSRAKAADRRPWRSCRPGWGFDDMTALPCLPCGSWQARLDTQMPSGTATSSKPAGGTAGQPLRRRMAGCGAGPRCRPVPGGVGRQGDTPLHPWPEVTRHRGGET